jgi:hypothetical protein
VKGNLGQQGKDSMSDWDLIISNDGDFSKSEGEVEYSEGGSSSSSGDDGELLVEATDYSILNRTHVARQCRHTHGRRSEGDDHAGNVHVQFGQGSVSIGGTTGRLSSLRGEQ